MTLQFFMTHFKRVIRFSEVGVLMSGRKLMDGEDVDILMFGRRSFSESVNFFTSDSNRNFFFGRKLKKICFGENFRKSNFL